MLQKNAQKAKKLIGAKQATPLLVVCLFVFLQFLSGLFVPTLYAQGELSEPELSESESWEPILETLAIETQDKTTLRGIRLKDSRSRIPLLLIPGFAEDSRYFKTLAETLFATGHFEPWTIQMRGLGASHRRSAPEKGGHRNYGFDFMVGLDIPAMIREIYLRTGRKAFILGHSLGGMASSAALSGARMGEKGIYLDKSDKNIKWWQRRVRGFLSLGAPVSFDHQDPVFEAWRRTSFITNHIVKLLAVELTLNPFKPASALSSLLRASYLKITESAIHQSPIRLPLLHGYLNSDRISLGKGELYYYISSILSDVEPELRHDVNRWRHEGLRAENGFSYNNLPLPHVPSLIATGEKDALIPFDQFQKHWQQRRRNHQRLFGSSGEKVQIVGILNAGHVDVAYGREAVQEISSILFNGRRRFMSPPNPEAKTPKSYQHVGAIDVGAIGPCLALF